jgi:phosphotransferase system HPr-like phosphotransfer protein
MCKADDILSTIALVDTIAKLVTAARTSDIPMDVVIDSLSAVLGACICEKHRIVVKCAGESTTQIVEAATKIITDNKISPTPTNN